MAFRHCVCADRGRLIFPVTVMGISSMKVMVRGVFMRGQAIANEVLNLGGQGVVRIETRGGDDKG